MKTKRMLILGFLLVHLLFIFFCNISALSKFDSKEVSLSENGHILVNTAKKIEQVFPAGYKKAFDVYARYSGITGYVFFSPNPPDSYRCYFTYMANGQSYIEELPMKTFEGDLRKLCGYDYLKDIANADYRDLFARSVAARFFELHPQISEATLTTAYYSLPAMEAYAKGAKPVFSKHLTYRFKYN